jgi:glycerol uptake facilitator-like aquaporin
VGAVVGVIIAHAMFGLAPVQASQHVRASDGELIGEVVATSGLLLTIWGTVRAQAEAVPYTVAAYIVGAYWFTSSTSFANPAVTMARSLTDTFAGIAPGSVPGFIVAQLAAIALAVGAVRVLGSPAR